MKRKIIIGLVSVALLWGLLFALQFTPVGYILIGTCGMEYCRTESFWRDKLETEGDLPPSFSLQLGGCASKQGTIVPCLLLYSLDKYTDFQAYVHVPRDWNGAQYLDLMKLEVVMQDGRREELIRQPGPVKTVWGGKGSIVTRADSYASGSPVRFYLGAHPNARRFIEYRAGMPVGGIQESAEQGQACLFSTLWPPTEKVTLIAEGSYHHDIRREDQRFRQVSTWTIIRGGGIRRVWLP